nr:nitrilase-related carbon-nitrogen hydrolase [uncultured Sulfurimonas sp.]
MIIATVSLEQIWEDKKDNLSNCQKFVEEASKKNAELIIFPEMTLTAFTMNIKVVSEIEPDSFTIKSFQKLAIENKIAIVFGVIIKEEDKASNRLYFLSKEGKILGNYKKIHPFTFANEDKYFNAGQNPQIVEYNGVKFGLSICYDLRFSSLYQYYTLKETDCILNIANWPVKRIDHWNTLLKARAIENQQFIIGVNRTGKDANNLEYIESSNIYNANGEKLSCKNQNNEIKVFNIDLSYTKEFKKIFNTVQDIDTPEDWKRAEFMYEALKKSGEI